MYNFFKILLVCGILYGATNGQDLQFECITCADKFDKCELDCAWTLQSYEMKQIVKCQSDCAEQSLKCVDSPAAIACLNCTMACSATYDNSMRRCLAVTGRTARATRNLSECEQNAFDAMDACLMLCSPQT